MLAESKLNNKDVLIAFDLHQATDLVKQDLTGGMHSFYTQLKRELKSLKLSEQELFSNFKALINSDCRFSVIPIHKEMYFHTLRSANASTADNEKAKQAFRFAYDHVYQLINADMANYLNQERRNLQALNQFIDKQRVKYATVGESMVMSHLVSDQTPLRNAQARKEILEKHTAANMDFVSTNSLSGLLTHVSGSDQSSHSKKEQLPAFMQIDQYNLKEDIKVQSQFRVPSLTIPKGDNIANDFQDENGRNIRPIDAQIRDFIDNQDFSDPIVYNLLTSLPVGIDSNSQEAAAKKIFKAMHVYNANRNNQSENRPLFYVMNLPINQHTHRLRYDGSTSQREALLLADLAMLNTVAQDVRFSVNYENSTLSVHDAINKLYTAYLDTPNRDEYFSSSPQGRQAIEFFTQFKDHNLALASNDNATLIKKAFLKLYADKYKGTAIDDQKEYGSLAQALFLAATNNHNLKGCKSANERFFYIENINNLLLAFKEATLEFFPNLN